MPPVRDTIEAFESLWLRALVRCSHKLAALIPQLHVKGLLLRIDMQGCFIYSPPVSDVTRILDRVGQGEANASEELLPVVYEELRKLAAVRMAQLPPGQTLQPTALVHEAWLRLVGESDPSPHWNSRGHFFAAAAEAMRRILVERARRKAAVIHGGGLQRIDLNHVDVAAETDSDLLLLVDEALTALAERNPTAAQLIKLRFFLGLPNAQAAEMLGVPERTATRVWAYARSWLYREIEKKR